MSEWQPIETAPKDGTQFLFNAPDLECGSSIGQIINGVVCSSWDGKPLGVWVTKPTHWMPLPDPPRLDDAD